MQASAKASLYCVSLPQGLKALLPRLKSGASTLKPNQSQCRTWQLARIVLGLYMGTIGVPRELEITALKTEPASKRETATLVNDPLWYKDAIIYEVHVRSFYDSVDDGMGDFPGLTKKLDYLQDLGVTTIWVLPFCPSPWKDDGYDIADYTDVHPAYGTLRDFENFLREAHRRGLRVITELVLNHTSDQHQWFQRSRRAKPGSHWRNFYVWSDTPEKYKEARIIFKDFEPSN